LIFFFGWLRKLLVVLDQGVKLLGNLVNGSMLLNIRDFLLGII
jgi:hypothetical protein